jgi:hypothetical protein
MQHDGLNLATLARHENLVIASQRRLLGHRYTIWHGPSGRLVATVTGARNAVAIIAAYRAGRTLGARP